MRKRIFIACMILFSNETCAQLDVRAGISSTFRTVNFGGKTVYGNFFYRRTTDFFYGGNNFSLGPMVDLEYRFKRTFWKKDAGETFKSMAITFHHSIVLGFHFNDHVNEEKGFGKFHEEGTYRDPIFSSMSSRYLQVPLLYKLNVQPFILDEDFLISAGLGLTNSFLLRSRLKESVTIYLRDEDGNALLDQNGNNIITEIIEQQGDVMQYSRTYVPMLSFELSCSFRRMYMGMRGWFSLGDQYLEGLETNWTIEQEQSIYLGSYDHWRKVTYAGGSLILSYKLF